ncbi:MAG: RluA family pseudouridine synthase [Patescibacteria group bacterium]|jgi:23S rRNA pseudouridine1911/1915/1917 synthase
MKKERLDKSLVKTSGLARGLIQKMIKNSEVFVNEKPITTPHFSVLPTDKIEIRKQKVTTKKYVPPKLKVFYEDGDVIVFEKPAGIMVHEAPGKKEATIVDALVKHYPSIKKVGDNPSRPGIVHRLDKLASGVMIAAKTQAAFDFLKKQFSEHYAKKEYLVLVYGIPAKDIGTISFRLARSKNKGRMVARPADGEGKEAVTHYEVIKKIKNLAYLRVQIETGRTHQIRAHMRALNLPVVGDPLYKKTRMKNIKPLSLPRLFLHAHKLTIPLPNGETKTFVSPLPEELEKIISE